MLRLLVFLVLACIVCRVVFGKWPWDFVRRNRTREQAVFEARRLLGVDRRANRAQIHAAHKRLLSRIHPDRGGTSAQVHEADAARDLLLEQADH